jgi:hypothetical protein
MTLRMVSAKLPTTIQAQIDATKVSYVQLRSSGLRVSVPILGCMSFGSNKWADWALEEKSALRVLKSAWDRGTCSRVCFTIMAN